MNTCQTHPQKEAAFGRQHTGRAAFGRSPVEKPFVEEPSRCSNIKQQAAGKQQTSSRHQAACIQHQAARTRKLGSKTLTRSQDCLFLPLSVSYERMYPLMRGCINPKCQVSTLLGNTLVNQRQSRYGSMFINRSIVYKLDWGGHVDSVCPDEETFKQLQYPRSAYKSLAF